ncbi:hypothetical protein P280DRAFT_25711 [Massarina eburnea CBS 473.64]|uniref:Uncharacterized protein n=1 Tax=Massarina eburnea CBS 473.64 TaxID=1395130 RepID=A0A6A6S015_9PLEO|nr:hypothetical protein P280DRAFT_25711 [Massarina eburnea CBS 473.64]
MHAFKAQRHESDSSGSSWRILTSPFRDSNARIAVLQLAGLLLHGVPGSTISVYLLSTVPNTSDDRRPHIIRPCSTFIASPLGNLHVSFSPLRSFLSI